MVSAPWHQHLARMIGKHAAGESLPQIGSGIARFTAVNQRDTWFTPAPACFLPSSGHLHNQVARNGRALFLASMIPGEQRPVICGFLAVLLFTRPGLGAREGLATRCAWEGWPGVRSRPARVSMPGGNWTAAPRCRTAMPSPVTRFNGECLHLFWRAQLAISNRPPRECRSGTRTLLGFAGLQSGETGFPGVSLTPNPGMSLIHVKEVAA